MTDIQALTSVLSQLDDRSREFANSLVAQAQYDDATIAAVTHGLRAMANDPAGTAAAYGHLTEACCFCNRALTDERSTSVGYGPICAGHYGLPWSEREAA